MRLRQLKRIRRERGMSQAQLGRKINRSRQMVGLYERGYAASKATAAGIAKALGVPIKILTAPQLILAARTDYVCISAPAGAQGDCSRMAPSRSRGTFESQPRCRLKGPARETQASPAVRARLAAALELDPSQLLEEVTVK